jgi:uncharacterized protein (DUF1015 family)
LPEIRPFRGVHYDPARTHGLSDVIGPPEDVPTRSQVAEITAGRPHHSLRLEFGDPALDHPPDDLRDIGFESWLDEGMLIRTDEPAFYVHEHRFRHRGIYFRRVGLLALANLTADPDFGFRPHEGTIPENLRIRTKLLDDLRFATSPIFTLVRDQGRLGAMLDLAIRNRPPFLSGHDDEAGNHRLWKLDFPPTIEWVTQFVAGKPLYIADGHHRFAATQALRQKLIDSGEDPGSAGYVMTLIASENDPGVSILPIHREITRGDQRWEKLLANLEHFFEIEQALPAESVEPDIVARRADRLSDSESPMPEFLLLPAYDRLLYRIRLRDWSLVEEMVAKAGPPAVQRLDVTVLHQVILEEILGIPREGPERVVEYTPDALGLSRRVLAGESFLGIFPRTTRIEQVIAVADAGAHMPEKSTYFYPKVPAGLMIYDLMGSEAD